MAYKDSDELQSNENYALGDYSFRIERSSVPGSSNDKIEAICTDKDGKNARKSIQIPSSAQMLGWYVEANETEATVYVILTQPLPPLGDGVSYPIPSTTSLSVTWTRSGQRVTYTFSASGGPVTSWMTGPDNCQELYANGNPGASWNAYTETGGDDGHGIMSSSFTYLGKTVYYALDPTPYAPNASASVSLGSNVSPNVPGVAWAMVYGDSIDEEDTKMVGRFAIDLDDAGGVGPGSDWIDPGDYDPDWEPDDPTHTLYVTVTGALSGRHNDPIEDPSYSYIPSDKDTVKDYGCGGDGGHGGGGGAGASTVVIHKFATNQANSKEVTAIARRHGYGSGGGKGGKGGDGCILVYY